LAEVDIEGLYRRYGPMVLRRCRSLLRDPERAQDALQDVFVRLLQHSGELDDRAMSSLLYRIATQVSLNRLRTLRRRPEDTTDELVLEIASATDLEQHSVGRDLLTRILGNEPISTQTLAILHFVDGMTLEEVASEAKMSVSGVRKRLRTLSERLQASRGAMLDVG
jgi:RNA polymerase sigma-70 factor (ECF subfamily)